VIVFEMADQGLNGGTTAYLAADGLGGAPDLALIQTLNRSE
jgi:hypothetical protein